MSQRPIKGNPTGKYPIVLDPTNDIAAYNNGHDQLQDIIYLESVFYEPKMGVKDAGDTIMYSKEDKMKHYMDYCSICLCRFIKGQQVKIIRCRHCFHKQCIMPWLVHDDKCPNCRTTLSTRSSDNY